MLKVIKYLLYFLIGSFLLFFVMPVTFVLFLSPEVYKSSLVELIHKTTGRDVVIQGMMHWTAFPELGVSVDDLVIFNPATFASPNNRSKQFLSVKHCHIAVDMQSLVQHRLNINRVSLEGVKLYLVKNALGQTNWQFRSSQNHNEVSQNVSSNSKSNPTNFIQLSGSTLGDLNIKNSEIVYDDEEKKKTIDIQHLNLAANKIAPDQSFPIQASFVLLTPKISTPINVNLSAQMRLKSNASNLHIDKIQLNNIEAKTNQYEWKGFLEDSLSKEDLTALSGKMVVEGSNGAFNGIDLYYYSDLADALIHKTQPTRPDTHQTPFKQLQAILNIQDGIVTNENLVIQADRMQASGKGLINLMTQQIDYDLSLQRLTAGADIKARGPAIPLKITGELSHPTIRPDWQIFLVGQLQNQLEEKGQVLGEKINKAIQEGLQSLVNR